MKHESPFLLCVMSMSEELLSKIKDSYVNCHWHSYDSILILASLVTSSSYSNRHLFSSDTEKESEA